MDTCKANKCAKNRNLSYDGVSVYRVWNDFKRCSHKVYKDGFCKKCYEHDTKDSNLRGTLRGIPDQLWKRNGIYGEPYDFPYHQTKKDKDWVEMIHTLHPHIRPVKKDIVEEEIVVNEAKETAEEKIAKIIIWLDNNSEKINYKLGSELKEILF